MNKELVTKVNGYLANLGIEYVKLHNLHWNVVGLEFKATHEYLESLYDDTADALDEVAELLRKNGELPLASMKDYLDVATIKELDTKEIAIKDALTTACNDLETLNAQAIAIRTAADQAGDFALVNMMEDHLSDYSKKLWFIKSMLK
ncbi:MAG: DNA starvation/stationary phase protection protein [Treponema sp.]|nr:DNA starvation/stationary phase protection protein [Treponema sp.]